MRTSLVACALWVAILAPASVDAAPNLVRIEFRGGNLAAPVSVADGDLAMFTPWAGPGVTAGGVAQREGFIADWSRSAWERPKGLSSYEVLFFVGCSESAKNCDSSGSRVAYLVLYEVDRSSGKGSVYIPGLGDIRGAGNRRTILRGDAHENHWFEATAEWDEFARPLLQGL